MHRKKHKIPQGTNVLFKRVVRNFVGSLMIIAVSLGLGIWGYRHFENMDWVTAYENAAMILSGMGPVDTLQTKAGKIFAGSYALFSGIVFLVVIAVIVAPIFHHFFHKFIMDDSK